jgi:hypothetical protein
MAPETGVVLAIKKSVSSLPKEFASGHCPFRALTVPGI